MRKGLLVIPWMVFMLVGAGALGQGPGRGEAKPSDCLKEEKSIRPPVTPQNAAIEYFKVWDSLPKAEFEAISYFGNMPFLQNDPVKLAPLQRELCLRNQVYIDGLMRCAAMPECDWGVQHQYGEDYRASHLKLLRDSYRALVFDYDRCVEDRGAVGAAARLAAMVQMADQTRTDRSWFSVLIASNVIFGTFDRARDFLKWDLITPATAKVLLAAYRSIRLENLFGWVEAMEQSRWEMTQWPRSVCTGERAGATYFEKDGGLNWGGAMYPRAFLLGRNEAQLDGDLDKFDAYFAKVLPLWKDPANDLKLRELEVQALEGQFGLVAAVRADELERTRRNMWRARRQIEQVVGELEGYLKKEEQRAK
jgi:hypothetical protein